MIQHRIEPDELTAKHLAMLGSAVLVLAHAMRDKYATSNTVAGEGAPQAASLCMPKRLGSGHVQ